MEEGKEPPHSSESDAMVKRDRPATEDGKRRRPAGYEPEPIPWHFKLLGILFIPYLLFRLYQIAHWLIAKF
jgi:hypothetical protein